MPNRDLVVIGASAGGIEALQRIFEALPADLNAAILVVLHMSPQSGGALPRILSRVSTLKAKHPEDGEHMKNGRIYVAPPDRHLIVEAKHLRVIRGPRENRHRPAIDPTFRSAARSYGRRVIAVVLTGSLDDGTSGLMVVRAAGGEAIVQDPETALFPSMPSNALKRVPDANVASIEDLPNLLVRLVNEELPDDKSTAVIDPSKQIHTVAGAEFHMPEVEAENKAGEPSQFACPECGGVLWEINQAGFLRYRCRVGHAYTPLNLQAEQRHAVETALWAALRALEESASLYQRMADKVKNFDLTKDTFVERADIAQENANVLREFLVRLGSEEAELGETAEQA